MKLRSTRPTLVAVFFVLGVMLVTAFNTSRGALAARPQRSVGLASVVEDMERQRRELQDQLAALRAKTRSIERRAATDAGVRQSFTQRLDAVRAEAGLSPVSGFGVEVSLADAASVPPGTDPNAAVIHDYDVTAVANALACGGARAISVNDERVVATTSIRCAGNTILVNGTRVAGPYVVRAVGDPVAMTTALEADSVAGPLLGTVGSRYGLRLAVSRGAETVPAYRGLLRPEVGKVGGGGGS